MHGKKLVRSGLLSLVTILGSIPFATAQGIREGATLQLLSNLHPDIERRLLYTMNYQLPNLLPVCSEVTVRKLKRKEMTFDYQGVTYKIEYEKHTRGAGVAFETALGYYFGSSCDQAQVSALTGVDREGVERGQAIIGMSRDAGLLAMGRPPVHVNPTPQNQQSWTYWKNRFGKLVVEFDNEGKVSNVIR